jgi:hypothetical protein
MMVNNEFKMMWKEYIVIRGLKARIVEPEETAVARQWLCKHVSKATRTRDRYRYEHSNRRNVGGGKPPVVK